MTKPVLIDNIDTGEFTVDDSGDVQPVFEEKTQPHPVRAEDMPHEQSAVGLSGRAAVRAFAAAHRSDSPLSADLRNATPKYIADRNKHGE